MSYLVQLKNILENRLDPSEVKEVQTLFTMVFPDLLKAKIGNPVMHHVVVIDQFLSIAKTEQDITFWKYNKNILKNL